MRFLGIVKLKGVSGNYEREVQVNSERGFGGDFCWEAACNRISRTLAVPCELSIEAITHRVVRTRDTERKPGTGLGDHALTAALGPKRRVADQVRFPVQGQSGASAFPSTSCLAKAGLNRPVEGYVEALLVPL